MKTYSIRTLPWEPVNTADLVAQTPAGDFFVFREFSEWRAELQGLGDKTSLYSGTVFEAAVAAADAHWVALLAPFLCQVTE